MKTSTKKTAIKKAVTSVPKGDPKEKWHDGPPWRRFNTKKLELALRKVPGFISVSAMDGYGHAEPYIFIDCDSIKNLNRFLWAFCWRWGLIDNLWKSGWEFRIANGDTAYNQKHLNLLLVGRKETGKEDCDSLAKRILMWLKNEKEATCNFTKPRKFGKVKPLTPEELKTCTVTVKKTTAKKKVKVKLATSKN